MLVVHQRQRLRRDVRHVTTTDCGEGFRKVKSSQERVERIPCDSKIDAPAIRISANRFAVQGRIETTRDREQGIANGFGFKSLHVRMSEQIVVGVRLDSCR